MASATVNSNAADIDLPLQVDSVPAIDLTLISQSELYSLSLCSSSALDTHRCGDLVNPKIDRSVFNESAGSRKQTYSRLRLAPATLPSSPSALRRRGPVIRSTNFNAPLPSPDSDSEIVESQQIVGLLKELFGAEDISIDNNDDYTEVGKQIIPIRAVPQISCAPPSELNRKMGKLPKHKSSDALVGNMAKALCEDISMGSNDDYTEVGKQIIPTRVDYSDAVPRIFRARPSELNRKMVQLPKHKTYDALVGNKAKALCESNVVRMTMDANDIQENVEARFDVFEYKDDVDLVENKYDVDLMGNKDDVDLVENKNDVDLVENKDDVDDLALVENKDDDHVENKDNVDLVENKNDLDIMENKDDVDDLVLAENKDDVHVENKEESSLETNTVVIGMMSEIVVQRNVDDRDMEMLNRDGIVVDLVGLGFVEDPYAAELGKRTEGMSREEDLLAFLSGLRGEWVSRRKKRRIVDASDFGNALPKGWRLMLACKKKGGGVWLFCRRYLSPNGRQFVSCKEISAYLLSLHGSHDVNQMSFNQHNLNVGENNMDVRPADKFDVTNTAVMVVSNENREENDVSRFLSQAFASMSGDYGVQVCMGAPDPQPVVKAGRSSNGDKRNLMFNYQDDLLHHQVSSHQRKKSKVSVTDGVIIKEGKYECQFCHKAFDERKRYNGHMGSHVRGQVKIPDESRPEDVGDAVSIDNNHYRDPVVLPLTGTDNTLVSIVTGNDGGDVSNSNLPHGSADQLDWNTEANAVDVNALGANEALRFEFDAALSNSENNRQPEIHCRTDISNVAGDGNENPCNEQETFSEGCSAVLLDKQRLVSNEVAIGSEKSCNEQTRISEGSSSLPFIKRAGSFISNEAADDGIDKCSNEQERTSEGCSPLPFDKHSDGFSDGDDSEKCCNEQDGTSDGCSPNPLHNQTGSFDDMINGLFEPNRETISGSALHGSNENLESCDIDWDSTDFSHAIDGLGISEDKIMGNDPVLDFSGKSGVDSSSFDVGKLHSGFKDSSGGDVNMVKGKSVSISEGSQQKIVFETSKLISSCGKEIENNKDVYGLFTTSGVVMNEHDNYGSKDHTRSAEFDRAAMNSLEMHRGAKLTDTELPLGDLKAQQQSKTFSSLFTSLSSVGGSMGVDMHADNVPSKMIQEHQVNDTQINDDTGLRFPFPTSNNVPTVPSVSDDKEKIQFGFRSFFPSENRKQFVADGNRVNRQSSVVVESKDRSLATSYAMGSPHEAYSSNKMFPSQLNEHGTIVDKNPKSHGLCLAFDSQESSSVNQLEQFGTKNFGIHHGMAQAYGVPHNLNNFGLGATGNTMEGGRGFGIDMHDSSFSDKSSKFENSFDLSYPSRIWDGARVDATVNSSNKFMADFVNRNTQPSGDVMTGSMWRPGDVNLLQHNLANVRPPLVQSSNSFHTFDIISEKGHGGLYEVNQKYNTSGDFQGLTLGRSEPTEYTFMATQNSNSISGEAKGLSSYNVHSQPDFNSSFWLGKDALMPSMTARNRVPSICVWCRNEFYEEATPSGAQAGAIGSMCSTCSSGISHQLNVLR